MTDCGCDKAKAELEEYLHRELSDQDFRLAVYFADVEGFSYQEIADIMKTPVGTVMSRLHRGRRMLRGLLTEYASDRGLGVGVPAAAKGPKE